MGIQPLSCNKKNRLPLVSPCRKPGRLPASTVHTHCALREAELQALSQRQPKTTAAAQKTTLRVVNDEARSQRHGVS